MRSNNIELASKVNSEFEGFGGPSARRARSLVRGDQSPACMSCRMGRSASVSHVNGSLPLLRFEPSVGKRESTSIGDGSADWRPPGPLGIMNIDEYSDVVVCETEAGVVV